MNSDAEKYFVTHDKGYFDKFLESEEAFGKGLRSLDGQSLSAGERTALDSLVVVWANVDAQVRPFGGGLILPARSSSPCLLARRPVNGRR